MDVSPPFETTLSMAPATSRQFNLPNQMEARCTTPFLPFTYQHSTLKQLPLSQMTGRYPLPIPLHSEQMQGLSMSALHKFIPETHLIIHHGLMIPNHPSTSHPVSIMFLAKMAVFQSDTTLTWDLFPRLDMTRTILTPDIKAKAWETMHLLLLLLSKKGLGLLMALENRPIDMKTCQEPLLIDKLHVCAIEIVLDLRSMIQSECIHVLAVIEANTSSIQNVHVIDIDAELRVVAIHFPSRMGLIDICSASMGRKELCTLVQTQHAVRHSIGRKIWRDTTRANIDTLCNNREFLSELAPEFKRYWQPYLSTLDYLLKYDNNYAQRLSNSTLEIVLQRIGDTNVLSFIHVALVFMYSISRYSTAMSFLQAGFPWELLAVFLNKLLSVDKTPDCIGTKKLPLPEDFAMRGLLWTENYFPNQWFTNEKIDEEKYHEIASMTERRKERILWLAYRIGSPIYLIFDGGKFKVGEMAIYDCRYILFAIFLGSASMQGRLVAVNKFLEYALWYPP